MKKTFILLLFCCILVQAFAQSYKTEFVYDYAGNRITRKVIVLTPPAQSPSAPDNTQETGIQDELSQCRITVYPNPTKGMLGVAISGGIETDLHKIYVYGASGQLLIAESLTGNGEAAVDLSGYVSGIYILFVRTGDEEKQYKIIKE